jgi:hypothetical protein
MNLHWIYLPAAIEELWPYLQARRTVRATRIGLACNQVCDD